MVLAPFLRGGEVARTSAVAGVRAQRAEGAEEKGEMPLKPSQCRAYMRRELAREFRGIVRGFVDGAKKGSCQHVKLAAELLATPKRQRRRKDAADRLVDELKQRGW